MASQIAGEQLPKKLLSLYMSVGVSSYTRLNVNATLSRDNIGQKSVALRFSCCVKV